MADTPTNRPIRAQATSGFPSPASDSAEASLDLRDLVTRHPAATFYLRVRGEAHVPAGIYAGDVLVVDRSLRPIPGRLVIVATQGELRLLRWASHEPEIAWTGEPDGETIILWGVVTYVIHQVDAIGGDTAADALEIE